MSNLTLTVTRAHWHAFLRRCRHLEQSQRGLLARLLRRSARTTFGNTYELDRIESAEDYAVAVPISTWETLAPYVERIIQGNARVLTNDPLPPMLNRTSGTTGRPKLIPVTAEVVRGNALVQRLWAYAASTSHAASLSGKRIPLVSKAIEGYTPHTGIPYGSLSGLMFRDAHPLAVSRHAYPYAVTEIDDSAARRYALMRCALPHRVSFIPGSNPNALVGLFESADAFKADLIRDIHDGTLSDSYDIAGPIRRQLTRGFKPNPRRARMLERCVAQVGRLRPREYWPDLRLIGCWKGGTLGHLAAPLYDWCSPDLALRDSGYIAAEAQVTIPIGDEGTSGLLTIHSNFFELVPEGEFGRPDATVLMAHQLEPGVSYQILLTTPAGLYRYAIDDVVEVTGFYAGAPLVRFLRRGRDRLSLQGEKVTASQALEAVRAACREVGVRPTHFMLVGETRTACYHLYLEPAGVDPGREIMHRLLERFVAHMCRVNPAFRRHLDLGLLRPCALSVMASGWLGAILEAQIGQGMRDTQLKPSIIAQEAPCRERALYRLESLQAAAA